MPPTDVVRHNLRLTDVSTLDLTNVEPIPLPVVPAPQEDRERPAIINPPTTTRVSTRRMTTAPYRSVGKFFYELGGGAIGGGTGWVVARRALITAGHCVYHHRFGGWITAAFFCPRNNVECPKIYVVRTVFTLRGWIASATSDDYRYDMAACVITEDFADAEPPLAFDTGVLPPLQYTAIGYPATPIPGYRFNGKRMWRSVGEPISSGNGVQMAENNLTEGASGGPWCEAGNVVSGLTSFRYNTPNIAGSPLFSGGGFQNLYDAVRDL